ncbi:MAG: hypothetical protein LUM44_01455 [Pyrinomonadaceae bacterium]|nr:hypothetical protein [Pyrinomonadaceae bacterium]
MSVAFYAKKGLGIYLLKIQTWLRRICAVCEQDACAPINFAESVRDFCRGRFFFCVELVNSAFENVKINFTNKPIVTPERASGGICWQANCVWESESIKNREKFRSFDDAIQTNK